LVRARKEATRLAVERVKGPFSPEGVAAARQFLSGAGTACEAFAQLERLSAQDVWGRIGELGARRGVGAGA